jgi:metal-responsive CopG/Arc/MetJ family transcriptional regulator
MKTAISLDDDLLREADETARQMGLSRSRLLALALRDYLVHRRREKVLAQLNEVYANAPSGEEKRTTTRMKSKFRSTITDRW